MDRMFNKYGVYTNKASALATEFRGLVSAYLRKYGKEFDSIDMQMLMTDCISYEMGLTRLSLGAVLKQEELDAKSSAEDKKEEELPTVEGAVGEDSGPEPAEGVTDNPGPDG